MTKYQFNARSVLDIIERAKSKYQEEKIDNVPDGIKQEVKKVIEASAQQRSYTCTIIIPNEHDEGVIFWLNSLGFKTNTKNCSDGGTHIHIVVETPFQPPEIPATLKSLGRKIG